MDNSNFYALLSRMKYINRWGLMRNSIEENIAEHSLETAFIAHGLSVISNTYFGGNVDVWKVTVIAMFHDTTEIITGDMPTPVKYLEPGIRDSYKKVEYQATLQLLGSIPGEMRKEYEKVMNKDDEDIYRFVKAADKISALIKCMEEERMGNKDFKSAKESTLESIHNMHMPEAEYFLDNFIPSYNYTLDELTK